MADGNVADRLDSGTKPSGSVGGTKSDTARTDTLGETLRRARQQRGLTVQQISATTRLPVRHLEALEHDDIHAVPGGMYLRAEIRAYADAVGLDRSVALSYLQAALDPPLPPPTASESVTPPSQRTAVGRTVAVAAGVVIALAAIVTWRFSGDAPQVAPNDAVSEAPPAPDPVRASSANVVSPPTPDVSAPQQAPVEAATPGTTSGTTGSAPVPVTESAPATTDLPAPAALNAPGLEIVTEPAGARVTIDGVGWGVTPVTIRYLPPGTKQLRVTRDGFAAEERAIRFSGGQSHTSIRIELHKAE